MHASTSSAASAAITIAPVDSGRSPLLAFAFDADAGAVEVAGTPAAGVEGTPVVVGVVVGVAPAGAVGAVAPPDGAYVVVGVVAPGVVAVALPAVTPALGLCGRALAGTGREAVPEGLAAAAADSPAHGAAEASASSARQGARARARGRSWNVCLDIEAITPPC